MFPTVFVASDPSGKAGVAILIKRFCPIRILALTLDPHGWYVLLNCVHLKTFFTLANIYAPNSGQIGFLTKVLERLRSYSQPFTIVGGDLYMCMSNRDRCALFQHTAPLQAHKLSSSFQKLIWSHNLFDAWRVKHPTHRQYTFYLSSHKLYSRLDHFLVSTPLLPNVVSSEINPITWSNHAPSP